MINQLKSQKLIAKPLPANRRSQNLQRPFWLPALNFYLLATAVAVAVFFIAWAALNAAEEEAPLLTAGLLAIFILGGAVILREIIIRSVRYRIHLAEEKLDYNIKSVRRNLKLQKTEKITFEENQAIMREIDKRVRTARNFPKLPENHWQVFELCHDYLKRNEHELKNVGIGSPRIQFLRNSRERVQDIHKYHLLMWSSIESRAFIQEAKVSSTVAKKIENANKALTVLDAAGEFYPNETEILDSIDAVKEFMTTVKVSHWTEQAERAAFKGNYKRAISHYRDALFYLARENVRNEEKEQIAENINSKIENLRKLLDK